MSDQVTARLEAVAARLERVAAKLGGGGGGDDEDGAPMWVGDYEAIMKKELAAVVKAVGALGIPEVADHMKAAYENNLDCVQRAANAKKPTPQELMGFLKPGIDAISALDNMRYKGKNTKKWGDHYKAMYDAILVVSWVTMSPPNGLPLNHITGQSQSCDFNMNRVLKNDKSAEAKGWIKSMKELNKAIEKYVKEYFKSGGLTWNPKGGSLSGAKKASSGTSEKKESASTKKTASKKKGGGGGGIGALFGEINKGVGITKGMKKVTKDMKTKNRKVRTGVVKMKAKKTVKRKKFGDPATKFLGGRWMIENYEEGLIQCEKADIKSNVFITTCDNATVQITNKVKSVTIDNCVKCRIFVEEVISTIEMVNCKSCKIIVQKKAPSVAVDKCESASVILSREAWKVPPIVYTSNVTAMNIEVPGKTENDDNVEHPVPEQFITTFDLKTGSSNTVPTKH